ncbi:Similar to slc16a10: Monocarboxylate transporter 10 (Danio rerio) [Cotesia congregata]|uniref:Similar to slc16a10: Monocarboxylate transporter 10 (Danio rerio) n=1 Tax=Cotesia congregata TaxID=51543 RepID=A0A8J2HC81_COTCN|nr:Similar to slc16a10: Monocarboxylate transporter 10 (Danio rerio) [Cotesia congregata]
MTATDYNESNADGDSAMAQEDTTKRLLVTGVPNNKDGSDKFGNHPEELNPFIEQQSVVFVPDEYKSSNYFYNEENSKLKDGSREDKLLAMANNQNPPDGGVRAWMILLGSFIINGVLFSIINSYSLMQVQLTEKLKDLGETNAEAKASLVGSLTIGTTFFLSPIAGILTDKIGIQVIILCLTYGIMYGTGASLAYTPSLVILGHYFKRRLGLANGIVTAGSSVFTSIMPYVMSAFLERFGMVGALRSLAILTLIILACAILFKPVAIKETATIIDKSNCQSVNKSKKATINLSIWKKKRYVVWASAIPLALFGYFVPYVYIGSFVIKSFGKEFNRKIPVMCIGITSGIGRLVFGYIADLPRVNRILLQQISFISIGILTMLLPLTPPYYSALVVIALLFGLFDGCFISLLGPIAFDICGKSGATQAIGFLLGICSIPLTAGPPVGGLLIEHTDSFTLTFVVAGIPPIIGAIVMFAINCVEEDKVEEDPEKIDDGAVNADCCLDGIAKKGLGSLSRLSGGGSVQSEGRSFRHSKGLARTTAKCNTSLYNSTHIIRSSDYHYSSAANNSSIFNKSQNCYSFKQYSDYFPPAAGTYSESLPLLNQDFRHTRKL